MAARHRRPPARTHNTRGEGGRFTQSRGTRALSPTERKVLQMLATRAGEGLTAHDTDWGDFVVGEGRGLSPIVDVLRGLGDESAGLYAREPRLLRDTELSALGRDGIGRRCISIKVIQALAPGYTIDLVGLPGDVAQGLLEEATEVYNRVHGKAWVLKTGVSAMWYGKAMMCASWKGDAGITDLHRTLIDVADGPIRWVSGWDRRDYRVRDLASSQSTHYRQGEGATWLDLYAWQPALEYDRVYGGLAGRSGEPAVVHVNPSRYVQLTTPTGFSIFQECAVYIANLLSAAAGGASLMQRAAAAIFEIDDWEAQSLAGGTYARDKFQAQFEGLSNNSIMLLAKGEKMNFANLTTTGIEGGIYSIAYLLSAATGIPMTILLGTSPGAFVSGDQQIKQWHQELDATREWLEPALRFVWDMCLREVTGGLLPQYKIVWSPYETPSPKETIDTQAAAFNLASAAVSAGFLTVEDALQGLSKSGALAFEFSAKGVPPSVARIATAGAAVGNLPTVPAPAPAPTEAPAETINTAGVAGGEAPAASEVESLSDVALNGAQVTALVAVASDPILSTEQKRAIIMSAFPSIPPRLVDEIVKGTAPSAAAVVGAGGAPLPPTATVAEAGVSAPSEGVSEEDDTAPPAPPEPTAPGEVLTDDDINSEAWVGSAEMGEHFGFSDASIKSLCTAVPGVMPAPGEIAWLQHPTSGRRRYRKTDLARALTHGRRKPDPLPPVESDASDRAPITGWPVSGLHWRMIREGDETGVSGTGIVVQGILMCDGTVVSWWVVPGMPPRPHVDSAWADFYSVHIEKHPSNGTRIEQWEPVVSAPDSLGGMWVPVVDTQTGPLPPAPRVQITPATSTPSDSGHSQD
jgi:hypothetical protein